MGALDGLKVLDLTSMVSGPVAAMMLADQGARVIKVEPLAGEQMRHLGSTYQGVNPGFFSCNRGKESIALDLKSEEGKSILLQLARMRCSGTSDPAPLNAWASVRIPCVQPIPD